MTTRDWAPTAVSLCVAFAVASITGHYWPAVAAGCAAAVITYVIADKT